MQVPALWQFTIFRSIHFRRLALPVDTFLFIQMKKLLPTAGLKVYMN
jgi:hypothetical protein